jgi:hypothetical protein
LTPKQQIYKEKKDLKMEALQIIKPEKERARNVDTKKPTLFVVNGSNDGEPLLEKMLDGYPQVHVSEFNCLDTTNGFVFRMRRRNWWLTKSLVPTFGTPLSMWSQWPMTDS